MRALSNVVVGHVVGGLERSFRKFQPIKDALGKYSKRAKFSQGSRVFHEQHLGFIAVSNSGLNCPLSRQLYECFYHFMPGGNGLTAFHKSAKRGEGLMGGAEQFEGEMYQKVTLYIVGQRKNQGN